MIPDPVGDAVAWLRDGGLVAYPTETVWGLGAVAASEPALARLRSWKGRASSDPVALLIAEPSRLEALGFEPSAGARRLAEAFWPGPLTLVLPCARRFAAGVARADGAVGVRCSAHPLAASLARRIDREAAGPITATSLNRSGEPAARTADEARALCRDGRDAPRLLAVEGAEAGGEMPSTVVDLAGPQPRVLRWGAIARDRLEPVLREIAAA